MKQNLGLVSIQYLYQLSSSTINISGC